MSLTNYCKTSVNFLVPEVSSVGLIKERQMVLKVSGIREKTKQNKSNNIRFIGLVVTT